MTASLAPSVFASDVLSILLEGGVKPTFGSDDWRAVEVYDQCRGTSSNVAIDFEGQNASSLAQILFWYEVMYGAAATIATNFCYHHWIGQALGLVIPDTGGLLVVINGKTVQHAVTNTPVDLSFLFNEPFPSQQQSRRATLISDYRGSQKFREAIRAKQHLFRYVQDQSEC